jgi:hypothetical protein
MAPAARPTDSDRNAAIKARRDARRPKFTKPTGVWTFTDVRALCKVANLTLHLAAEEDWKKQQDLKVSPSNRTIKMVNGDRPRLDCIVNGNTSGILATPAQKISRNAKISDTKKARGHKQRNWVEAAAIKQFVTQFSAARPGYVFTTNPDGIGADFNMRREGEQWWAAIQMKSGMAHPRERVNLSVTKKQGQPGGKYEVRNYKCLLLIWL